MATRAHRYLPVLLVLSLLFPVATQAASGSESFQKGVAAYRADRLEEALAHFEAARDAGLDKPSLYHNLGTAYYRLGRYPEARRAFQRLLDDPGSAALAHYNLGLVARKLNEPETAREHFRAALRSADNPKIQRLAADQLPERETTRADRSPFSGLVSLGGGYSDNVTLQPDDGPITSGQSDTFLEALAAGTYQLQGDPDHGLQLKASALILDYADRNTFDQTYLRAGLEWDRSSGPWALDLAAYGDWITLGGDPFERVVTGEVDALRAVTATQDLRLRYRLSLVDGANRFEHLSGTRQRAGAEWRYDSEAYGLETGYELEYNDRDDLPDASVSPIRHLGYLETRWKLARYWEVDLAGSYRFSRYQDPHRTPAGEVTREDTRIRGEVGLSRQLPWKLWANLEYQYTRNDSNIDFADPNYEYEANVYAIRVERFF
ncbi:hypothetical protein AN478_11315 [Thiohalorhabdus denitrificans]|uniref:Tetratricopeptide repeat-containing protein n=1 Tax=Thiohalorhabdus denitrificans TaxID=381306 RepID=A0A0N8PMU4_9GAMM|nr:tetratricopeptide repeat protein [Thiohalorhabdus denitrificans]KPV39693.1 hypothetical protein AN478_11315 [Thiohalorhabdus denitrificans]SCX93714.1 Tetratricopeptide repeat-containing protein [Thiohalorhabdus denitrificans]